MMQAMPVTAAVTRRFADDQLVTLAKLVIESALQPIVEVSSGSVFGYESLMRGQQKLGFATPVELLDQANAVDLLLPMEQLLLGRAIAKFSAVPESPSKLLFVNFDARLMSEHEAVIDRMLQVLLRAHISPMSVCIELSERFDNSKQVGFSEFTKRLSA